MEELLFVLKVPVDGGKAHIGDLIEVAETLHEKLSDGGGGELPVGRVGHEAFRFVDDGFQLGHRHCPLFGAKLPSRHTLHPSDIRAHQPNDPIPRGSATVGGRSTPEPLAANKKIMESLLYVAVC